MNSTRRSELQASLRKELNRQSQERNLSRTGRLIWLLDQVENYVARWLGLEATKKTAGMPSDDLFFMIEIGAEAVSTECLDPTSSAESWHDFLAALAAVRAGNQAIEKRQLAESLEIFRSEILSSNGGQNTSASRR